MFERESRFVPGLHYAPAAGEEPLRIFGAPGRYVQGPGIMARAGHFISSLGVTHAAVLSSRRSQAAEGRELLKGLDAAGFETTPATFAGECSFDEIHRHATALEGTGADVLVAVGGGKCVDTGKSIADRLGVPLVVVPTLASNDAPCSAVSVIYTPEGASDDVEFFPVSPAMVLVDTAIVAAAAERYLVAGMGDAMATGYEARVTAANPHGATCMGGRPTLAGEALSELCGRTLYADGVAAAAAVAASAVTPALERIVEANTLLSGLGFESGGLAAAHAIAQGFTVVPEIEHANLHGELVAMGLLVQLVLEERPDELERVARFSASVGLPVHLGQLGPAAVTEATLDAVLAGAMDFPFLPNMPSPVNAPTLRAAVGEADRLGRRVHDDAGDAAYRRLRA